MRIKAYKVFAYILILTLVVPLFPVRASSALNSKVYYVSCLTGADTNVGSLSSPFKTISKASEVMQAGDTCYIMEGTYREEILVNKSGTEESPITFAAYGDADVVIIATETTDKWSLETVNGIEVYAAGFSEPLAITDTVFYESDALEFARWPDNNGIDNNPYRSSYWEAAQGSTDKWMFPNWAIVDSVNGGYTVCDAELSIEDGSFNNALFVSPSGSGWYMQKAQITDSGEGFFTLDSGDITNHEYYLPKSGNPYYICATKAVLTSPGEWLWDDDSKKIYIVPPAVENFDPSLIEVKQRRYGFSLGGNDHIVISGITMMGAGVDMADSDYVTVENCNIYHASESIKISGNNNHITGCTLKYNPQAHIEITGKNNVLRTNTFEYSNTYSGNGGVVLGSGAFQNTIAFNTLRYAAVSGINFGQARKSLIYGNDISHFGAICNDNGGIYCGNTDGVNSEICYNRVHDSMAAPGFGIYMDNGSSNMLIHHNIVYNCGGSFQANMPMTNLVVYNNTLSGKTGMGNYAVRDSDGCKFVNNIAAEGSVLEYSAYDTTIGGYDRRVIMNYNNLFVDGMSLENLKNSDFVPQDEFPGIDRGVKLEGITDGYKGISPDIGAREYGSASFAAGAENDNGKAIGYSHYKYENHISDGGFELPSGTDIESETQWKKTGAKTAVITRRTAANPALEEKRHNGDGGIKIGSDSGSDGIKQTVSGLKPNTPYMLTAWGRVTNSLPIKVDISGGDIQTITQKGEDMLLSLDIDDNSKYMDFALADVVIGQDGRKAYGLIALDSDKGFIGIEEDSRYSAEGVTFVKWTDTTTSGGNTHTETEEKALSNYSDEMLRYIKRTDWHTGNFSGSKYIVRSKVGFGTVSQLTACFDSLRTIGTHVKRTVARDIFEWNGSLLLRCLKKGTSDAPELSSMDRWSNSCLYNYMVYVDSDFFKNIPLKTMGNKVKYFLRTDYSEDELSHIYSEDVLSDIGFGTEESSVENTSFDSSSWTKKEIEFVTDENGNVTLTFEVAATGLGYLDDITLTENIHVGPVDVNDENIAPQTLADSFSFTSEDRSFTILDEDSDKYLILANDLYGIFAFDADKNQRFDPYSEGNLAYVLNNDIQLPDNISAYTVANNIWQTEAGNNYGNCPEDYETLASVSTLSYSELKKYSEKIKMIQNEDKSSIGWWLRTPSGYHAEEAMYVPFEDARLIREMTTDIKLHIRPVFYLDKAFFKDVRIENPGNEVKGILFKNYNFSELLNLYTREELKDIGFTFEYTEKTKGNIFTAGDKTYILTNYIDTDSGKKHFGIITTEKKTGTWQKALMQLSGTPDTTQILYYPSNTESAQGQDIESFKDELFPPEYFGSNLLSRSWTLGTNLGPTDDKNTCISEGTVGLPSVSELQYVSANNELTPAEGDRYFMTRDVGFYQTFYYNIRYDPINNKTSNISFDTAWKTVQGGSWCFMAYVSEEFFKTNKIDFSSMGSDARKIVAENISRDDFEASGLYSEKELDVLYGGNISDVDYGIYMEGNNTGDKLTLKCFINNNTENELPLGTVLLVNLYNENGSEFLGVKIYNPEAGANSFTLPYIAKFDLDENKNYIAKAMLWKGDKNCTPLCKSETYK